uniref:Plastid-encoded RNA polymerase subunit alpha n=1 Tax=Eutreptiella gymnastica TaxID=73025 RepID=I0J3P0_9EUGL|nr:DNA-directed RNA polymerase subunit alpha [Eutreptiella gymnastica]CCE26513.1 DNA-directed RNA polymerase subunit alpha [Eutreptiella gymnastica]
MSNKSLVKCVVSRAETPLTHYSRFNIGSFSSGQGITVGNSLRRTLLEFKKNIAITLVKVKIYNAPGINAIVPIHEFSDLVGFRELTSDIFLNLQEIVLKTLHYDNFISSYGLLKVDGPSRITSQNLKLPHNINVVDIDQYIGTLVLNYSCNMLFIIESNSIFFQLRNFWQKLDDREACSYYKFYSGKLSPSMLHKLNLNYEEFFECWNINNSTIGLLALNPNFSVIKKVNYAVEEIDSGQSVNELVILEIWTNGSFEPENIILQACLSLSNIYNNLLLSFK